jgi:hypothetical protein
MERANYEFWSTFEEISISQAAYLWCGYEMPPDEPEEIVERFEGTQAMIARFERLQEKRIKGKSIPENVKLVLFQLIHAAISGQLLLNDGSKLEAETIKPWLIPETPYSIGPEVPNNFRTAITTKKRLRKYAKSIGQQPKFLFPDTHQKTGLTDSPIDKIIQSVIFGVEIIYDAVKELGFSGRDPMPFDDKKILYRNAARKKLSEIETDYPSIKREFLSQELFNFNESKQRRDFIGKLLKKILKDQGIKKTGSYDNIYKRSQKLK